MLKIFVLISALLNLVFAKFPSNIPVCHRYDPRISDCILNSVKTVQPRLATGMLGPGIQIPSLEPLYIKRLSLGNNRSLRYIVTNIYVYGASNFHIDQLRTNMNELKFDFYLTFPRLNINGKYKFILNLFGTSLPSQGNLSIVVDGVRAHIAFKAHRYTQNGREYVICEPIRIKIQRGNIINYNLSNLFDGNSFIGRIIGSLLLPTSEFSVNDIYPAIEKQLSNTFTNIANRVSY
ncbi:hypothetical protein PVAND_014690 [Polypedilum vanderplanki]|uniref:Uncharacterized protein n=1 Tax=Polypedilum vanderplanki TaxID=319348 RepID=A0A9J6BAX5_POLVA|nr:hypothetical protein PVAND_014690 [Polypedilum vanderplanki]